MRRVLLKLSGEALAGNRDQGIDPQALERLAGEVAAARASHAQVAVVCGAGNFVRGAQLATAGIGRIAADHMGMLATCMNALALADALRRLGCPTRVLAARAMSGLLAAYSVEAASDALEQGEVTVLAGGTGNPLFTTDTAACLRAVELSAEAVLKATQVDGVYTADPHRDPSAERFERLDFDEVIRRDLGVMDLAAICLCRDHAMPVVVFSADAPGALTRIIKGAKVGTRIEPAPRDSADA